MDDPSRLWLRWSARIVACLSGLFLSVFALDSFGHEKSFVDALPDFAIHLAPALLLFAVVALAWRTEWVGGLLFTGAAVWYACFARNHVSWVVTISTPLVIVGVLYFWSWVQNRNPMDKAQARP